MGTPDVSVNGSGVTTVLPGRHTLVTLVNSGAYPLYLDHVAAVSPQSFDFRILPGQAISWDEDRPLYAIADVGFTSALSVSNNVRAFTSPASISGAAATTADVLYNGPLSQFLYTSNQNALNVSAYQSLRWRFGPNLAVVPLPSSQLSIGWQGNTQASTSVFDTYQPDPTKGTGVEITHDVRDQFCWLSYNLYLNAAQAANVNLELTGYASKRPALAFDLYDPVNAVEVSGMRVVQYSELAAAIGTRKFRLPMWSGRMDVSWSMIANAAITTLPTLLIQPTADALGTIQGIGQLFTALPINTRDARAVVQGMAGGRKCLTVNMLQGAGYATADSYLQVTLYGSEDA